MSQSVEKPHSASEGRLQLDGGFLKNETIHCYKHKSNCQIEPTKITLPSYCEATQSVSDVCFLLVFFRLQNLLDSHGLVHTFSYL